VHGALTAIAVRGHPKPAKVATGSRSLCEPHRERVTAALVQGLSAKRIHQDLVADHAFAARYNTVKRFVHALSTAAPLPFRRIETAPGEEMQVGLRSGCPGARSDVWQTAPATSVPGHAELFAEGLLGIPARYLALAEVKGKA
jgi:hypothetical protein